MLDFDAASLLPTIHTEPGPDRLPWVDPLLHVGVTHQGEPMDVATLKLLGWSLDAAIAKAIDNLDRQTDVDGWTPVTTLPGLWFFHGDDGHTLARSLLVPRVIDNPLAGALVAAPSADQILVAPIDELDDIQLVKTMVNTLWATRQQGKPALTDQLLWVHHGIWEVLTVNHDIEHAEVQPTPRFMAAIRQLTSLGMAPASGEA